MWGQVVGGENNRWQPIKVLMVFSDIQAASTTAHQLWGLTDQPQLVSAVQGPLTAQRDNMPAEFVR